MPEDTEREMEHETAAGAPGMPKKLRKKIDLPSLALALVGIVVALTVQGLAFIPLLAGLILALQRRERYAVALPIVLCVLGGILALVHMLWDGFGALMQVV